MLFCSCGHAARQRGLRPVRDRRLPRTPRACRPGKAHRGGGESRSSAGRCRSCEPRRLLVVLNATRVRSRPGSGFRGSTILRCPVRRAPALPVARAFQARRNRERRRASIRRISGTSARRPRGGNQTLRTALDIIAAVDPPNHSEHVIALGKPRRHAPQGRRLHGRPRAPRAGARSWKRISRPITPLSARPC